VPVRVVYIVLIIFTVFTVFTQAKSAFAEIAAGIKPDCKTGASYYYTFVAVTWSKAWTANWAAVTGQFMPE
jgi:hypothetical protein